LDPVAIHVGKSQLRDGWAARALINDPAAVKGVVERLWPRELFLAELLASPVAPDLAVANPHRETIAFFDMGRRSRNDPGSLVIHKSAGNWPRSRWSSQEISLLVTIFLLSAGTGPSASAFPRRAGAGTAST